MGVTPPAAPESDAAAQENLLKESEALVWHRFVEDRKSGSDFSRTGRTPRVCRRKQWPSPLPRGCARSRGDPSKRSPLRSRKLCLADAASVYRPGFALADLYEALEVVRQLDPPGVACRNLRDCLLYQLRYIQQRTRNRRRTATGMPRSSPTQSPWLTAPARAAAQAAQDQEIHLRPSKPSSRPSTSSGRSIPRQRAAYQCHHPPDRTDVAHSSKAWETSGLHQADHSSPASMNRRHRVRSGGVVDLL